MEERKKSTMPFSVKLCSDKAAFEVRPLQKTLVKMYNAKQLLEKARGYDVVVFTPHIMILRYRGAEATLSKDGRMLIKRVKDESEAALVAQDIFRIAFKASN